MSEEINEETVEEKIEFDAGLLELLNTNKISTKQDFINYTNTQRVDSAYKFEHEKMPIRLNDFEKKLREELNPDETQDQKDIRELKKYRSDNELRQKLLNLQKEIGAGELDVNRYVKFGERAEDFMKEDFAIYSTAISDRVEEQIKQKFPTDKTPISSDTNGAKVTIEDLKQYSSEERTKLIQAGRVEGYEL